MIVADEMQAWLAIFRACWLAGVPCHEVLNACRIEWHRELVLSEYAKLGWADWRDANDGT